MNFILTAIFALVYVILAFLLALMGAKEGPQVWFYFELVCLLIAEAALWWWYIFLRRRSFERKRWALTGGALGLAIAMYAASSAAYFPLADWEYKHFNQIEKEIQISKVREMPLLSHDGDPIGIRLTYSIRFPNYFYFQNTLPLGALLHTEKDFGVEWWADPRSTSISIKPPVKGVKALGDAAHLWVRWGEVKGRTYEMTEDLLPNFLMWNDSKTRLCIVNPPPRYAEAFKRLLHNGPIHYRIRIPPTTYSAMTKSAYNLETFYESAVKEGAAQLQGIGPGATVGATNTLYPCK